MAGNAYCYYTPEDLAICLLKLIPKCKIRSSIDICCGKGALLKAAHTVFPKSLLVGVDINYDSFYQSLNQCSFCQMDGFKYVSKHGKKRYDLVLSNPPFGRMDGMNSGIIKGLNRGRLECQMMNANLSLMHSKSWMMIILPATFVLGSSYESVRKEIARSYGIHSVVKLPEDTFENGLINTFAVILSSSVDDTSTKTYLAEHSEKGWILKEDQEISYTGMQSGIWYGGEKTIEPLDIEVFRGIIKSSDFSDVGIPVYHSSTHRGKKWKPSVRYVGSANKGSKKAQKGDIIINRVGHSSGYWCVCKEDEIMVSDCIIVIRKRRGIVKCLKMISVDGKLDIEPRGVATEYITKRDIIDRITEAWRESQV